MIISYEAFCAHLEAVQAEIAEACHEAGRSPKEVSLLPVTKTHPAEAARYVARAGLPSVGENRVQEAVGKIEEIGEPSPVKWELIGHLQSNKAALAVRYFSRVQSVDSEKLLRVLDRRAAEAEQTLPILLQINAGHDPAKFGADLDAAPALLETSLGCAHLVVEGLMTIAPLSDDPDVARRTFENLRICRDSLSERFGSPLPELSMGMSGDMAAAIRAGSTQVRVGTALFGAR